MQTIKDLGSYTFPSLFKNTVKKFGKFNALSMVHGNPITYKELEELSVKAAKVLYKNNTYFIILVLKCPIPMACKVAVPILT